MMTSTRIGLCGFILATLLSLAACTDSGTPATGNAAEDDSDTSAPVTPDPDSGNPGGNGGPGNDDPASPGLGSSDDKVDDFPTSGDPATGSGSGSDGTPTDGSGGGGTASGAGSENAPPPASGGADLSGGKDDSPTATESASLQGPSIKDPSRGAGPPSVPRGLTLLLAAEDWLEFSWAPSTDDQAVKAYEIFRDGTLIATVSGDTGYEHDYRSWLSTSFIDCNYTRYTDCAERQPVPGATYSYTVVAVDNQGMRSAHSAPALFTLETRSSSPPDLTGYARVFNEDFDGSRLDINRWKTVLPWGSKTHINGEMQYFVNQFGSSPPIYDPFVFTGETLQITGVRTPPELLEAANQQPYLSGVITTSDYFEMTYGYVEMSARLAGGEGLLSTFYLFNQHYEKNKHEIDIIEYIGGRPDKIYHTYHYYDSNRARYSSGEKHSSPTMETQPGVNLSAGFHTYSVLWEPGLVVWYIDNEEVRRISGPRVSDEPMNIIAQLVVGSDWIGQPDASSIPAVFEIDYIRAWQKQ